MASRIPPDENLLEALRHLKTTYKRNKELLIARWLEINGFSTLDEAYEVYTATSTSASRPGSARSSRSMMSSSRFSDAPSIPFAHLSWEQQLEVLTKNLMSDQGAIRVLSSFVRRWADDPNIQRSSEATGEIERNVIRLIMSKLPTLTGPDLMVHLKVLSILAAPADNHEMVTKEGGIMLIFGTMISSKDVAAVQETACLALANLSTHQENALIIAREGGVLLLMEAMRRHATDVGVLSNACAALGNLCLLQENKKVIFGQDGVRVVLNVIRNHPSHCRTVEAACVVLANLCTDDTIASSLCDAGGLEMMIQTLEDCLVDPSVCAHTCAVLANACKSEKARSFFLEGHVCLVMETIRCHPRSDSVLANACGLLRNICATDRGRGLVESVGGVEMIMRVLQGHANYSIHVTQTASTLLYSLISSPETSHEIQQHGSTILFEILSAHPTNLKINRTLLGVLKNTALNGREFANTLGSYEISATFAALIASRDQKVTDSVAVLLASVSPKLETFRLLAHEMNVHPEVVGIFIEFSGASIATQTPAANVTALRPYFALIANLASSEISKNEFEKGAVMYFKFLDKNYEYFLKTDSPEALHRAAFSLYVSLVMNYDSARVAMANLENILTSTIYFIGDIGLLRPSLKLLGTLTLDETRSRSIVAGGGVSLISKALALYKEPQLIASLCAFLGSLSLLEENVSEIAGSGVIKMVIDAMFICISDGGVLASGFAALGSFAMKSSTVSLEPGLTTLLCGALETHMSNGWVVQMACGLIQTVSPSLQFPSDEKIRVISNLEKLSHSYKGETAIAVAISNAISSVK